MGLRMKTRSRRVWLPWALTSAWSILLCFLVLTPSRGTAIHDISVLFGGSKWTDALGHTALFAIQTALLYWALAQSMSGMSALILSVRVLLFFGTVLELAQVLIPARGSSLFDLSANWLGVAIFGVWQQRRLEQEKP